MYTGCWKLLNLEFHPKVYMNFAPRSVVEINTVH